MFSQPWDGFVLFGDLHVLAEHAGRQIQISIIPRHPITWATRQCCTQPCLGFHLYYSSTVEHPDCKYCPTLCYMSHNRPILRPSTHKTANICRPSSTHSLQKDDSVSHFAACICFNLQFSKPHFHIICSAQCHNHAEINGFFLQHIL